MRKLSFIVAVTGFVIGAFSGHGSPGGGATKTQAMARAVAPFDLAASIGQAPVRIAASYH